MHYHKLGYSFERHGGSGGYDALLNGLDEAHQIRLIHHAVQTNIQDYDSASFCLYHFWLNKFIPSTPGSGMSDTKVPGQLILGNTVDYKKFCCLQSGEYVQLHQEDETRNTIDIDRIVGAIALGPQYNLQGGYFLRSH